MADIETKEKEPVANEPNTNAAPPVDPVKQKEKKNFIKKIIIFAAILVTFLFLVNPSWLFFLPIEWRNSMKSAWNGIFGGDVSQVTNLVTLNWISLFKIVVIVLLLIIVYTVLKYILSKIQPKTGKGRSLLSMGKSFLTWVVAIVGIIWGTGSDRREPFDDLCERRNRCLGRRLCSRESDRGHCDRHFPGLRG